MKLNKYLLISALLLVTNLAVAEVALVPHKAEYKVKISVVAGRLNTELRETEQGYVANHVIRPTGLMARLLTKGRMDVTSEFVSSSDGIVPDRYRAEDTIRDKPPVNLHFDWDNNQATGTVGEEEIDLSLAEISYDSVSIQYALMHDLLNGKVSEQYVLFDIDKMRVANIRDAGSKKVKTKAGKFTAIGIQHQKEGSSRVTTLWCVEELGYLPVIIEQHRKGDLKFRATLLSYTPTPYKSTSAMSTASAP